MTMVGSEAKQEGPSTGIHRGLSAKEDRFAREYVVDLEKREAAIRAGYSKRGAAAQASRLLNRAKVVDRIAELQAALAGRIDLNAEGVVRQLMKDHKLAQDAGHHSAAVRATELLGKRLGLWIDRVRTEAELQSDDELASEVIDAAVVLAKGDKALKARLVAALGILDIVPGRRSEEARPAGR